LYLWLKTNKKYLDSSLYIIKETIENLTIPQRILGKEFSKKILNDIEIRSKYGFTYSLEYLIKAYDKNYKIEEYPSVWIERNIGKSRFTLTKWWKAYLKLYMYGIYTGLKKRLAFGK